MKRAFKLKTTPYNYVVLMKECDIATGTRWLHAHGCDADLASFRGMAWTPANDAVIYLWLEPGFSLLTLSHELIHVVFEVLRGSGVPVTSANDETITYLHEHLLACAMQKFRMRVVRE